MRKYLTTVLLCVAIPLIAIGIHISNLILAGIGASLVGVYQAMMHEMTKEK